MKLSIIIPIFNEIKCIDEFTYNLFHSSTADKGYNFIGYVDPAYDALAEEQRRTMDPKARKVLITDLISLEELLNNIKKNEK